jgi:hypothetical protein
MCNPVEIPTQTTSIGNKSVFVRCIELLMPLKAIHDALRPLFYCIAGDHFYVDLQHFDDLRGFATPMSVIRGRL